MKNIIFIVVICLCLVGKLTAQVDSLITILEKDLQVQINTLGEDNKHVALYCDSLGKLYIDASKYTKADEMFKKALQIKLGKVKERHPDIAESYHNLGNVCYYKAKYEEAIKYYNKSLDIRLEALGEKHKSTAYSYNNLGNIYYCTANYEKAINYYTRALNIRLEVLDENHSHVADSYNNLGITSFRNADYRESIEYHTKALKIRLEAFGEVHARVGDSYSNIGIVYENLGDNEIAIDYYNKALKVRRLVLGEVHPNLADSYDLLGSMYKDLGDYEKAIAYYTKALSIERKVFKEGHPIIADSYVSLGGMHSRKGEHEKAISYLYKALEIRLKFFGEDHLNVSGSYTFLGNAYLSNNNYDKAFYYYSKSLAIILKTFDDKDVHLANVYNNLGLVHTKKGEYDKAIDYHKKSLDIRLRILSKKHSYITQSHKNLAINYEKKGNYAKADSLWKVVINQNIKRLNEHYLFLPDNQRLIYAKTSNDIYSRFLSFTSKNGSDDTRRLVGNMLLNTKSLAMDYALSARELVDNTGDESLKKKYKALNAVNKNISRAELMTKEERRERTWDLAKMHSKREELSREIFKNDVLREKLHKTSITWEDTQAKLKNNEILLDFVRFYEYSDSAWQYCALLTQKNSTAPAFIPMTDQKSIATLLSATGKDGQPNYILSNEGLKTLYQKIWEPLTPYLKDVKTVHISPSGLLHRIDFEALKDGNDQYLAEQFEFHYYRTMRDFTEKRKAGLLSDATKNSRYKNVVLLGDIAYESTLETTPAVPIDVVLRDGIDPLPATKAEIEEVGEIVEKSGGACVHVRGCKASEKSIQQYTGGQSPDICHFATHAKYLSPLENLGKQAALQRRLHASGNPLQRSMLMLAGANNSWTSTEYIHRSDNDGILTAYEVTHMDFSQTELVVLSACNTALGDIHDTEGVLGLQSAFKLAGVNHVIASLWKVNDVATKELMVSFYRNLLLEKQDASTALRNAKAEMRMLGAKPVNWAGFVLF